MNSFAAQFTQQMADKALGVVLEGAGFPLSLLEKVGTYTRRQDDTNGETGREHELTVDLMGEGDVAITLDGMSKIVFRNKGAAAPSIRTRNAVIVLAEAIRRDNLDKKQTKLSGGDADLEDFMVELPAPIKKAVNGLLEGAFWIPTLSSEGVYIRRSDDANGDAGFNQELQVTFSPDGDAWIILPFSMYSLRFRTYFGGGISLRTRNALLVLAEAIRRDVEVSPQVV
jgi:hypothetical protein